VEALEKDPLRHRRRNSTSFGRRRGGAIIVPSRHAGPLRRSWRGWQEQNAVSYCGGSSDQ
jgi:hypothetical protein